MLKHRRAAASRGRLLLASLAALTVAFPATATATTTVYSNTFSGTNVTASWSSSPDPCGGYAQAYVFVNNGKNKDSVTGQSSVSTAVVYIEYFEACTFQSFSGYGSVDLSSGQFTVDKKLSTATLRTTVPTFDIFTQTYSRRRRRCHLDGRERPDVNQVELPSHL